MKNYWCSDCNNRWQGEDEKTCPNCNSNEIRVTMDRETAEKLGLI
jgi:Zn finger protein HypA/HybF involved in hydrogenase expression